MGVPAPCPTPARPSTANVSPRPPRPVCSSLPAAPLPLTPSALRHRLTSAAGAQPMRPPPSPVPRGPPDSIWAAVGSEPAPNGDDRDLCPRVSGTLSPGSQMNSFISKQYVHLGREFFPLLNIENYNLLYHQKFDCSGGNCFKLANKFNNNPCQQSLSE